MDGKKINRRDFLRLSALAASGATLAACGGQATQAPQAAATAVPATPVPAAKTPVEIRYINHWHVQADTHYKGLEVVYGDFAKAYPNIKLNSIDMSADESIPKIRADCGAGDCPEIMHQTTPEWWTSGWLLDLTDQFNTIWKDRFITSSLEPLTFDGHIFALPMEYSPLVTSWNLRVMEAVGDTTIPQTWEEYIAYGEKAVAKGYYLSVSASWQSGCHWVNGLVWGQPGGAEAMAAGKWDNDAIRFAFTRIKEDLYDKKLVPPNDQELDYGGAINLWQQDKVVAFHDGAWTINNNITPGGEDKFNFLKDNKVAFSPFFKTNGGLGTTIRVFSNGVGIAAAVKDNPAKLDAAIKWMDFWSSPEEVAKFVEAGSSPVAIKDLKIDPAKLPLLANFMDVSTKADVYYTGANPPVLGAHIWDHPVSSVAKLAAGASVDDAVKDYVSTMEKYKAQMGG